MGRFGSGSPNPPKRRKSEILNWRDSSGQNSKALFILNRPTPQPSPHEDAIRDLHARGRGHGCAALRHDVGLRERAKRPMNATRKLKMSGDLESRGGEAGEAPAPADF